ncbi:hypothetical protein TRIUR3_01441 [Triticum urartu]|uniref:Uncharacterized protein n=1 Tax=Triticum urartu TaxID=4572 RepID=M8A4S0_TRIUA|nr:hypothetical protein TRIUR3_01441 [Triticum urartu]
MPLPIQIMASRYGAPVLHFELRRQWWRQDGLPDQVPEVASGGHGSSCGHRSRSIRRRAQIQIHPAESQRYSRGDVQLCSRGDGFYTIVFLEMRVHSCNLKDRWKRWFGSLEIEVV